MPLKSEAVAQEWKHLSDGFEYAWVPAPAAPSTKIHLFRIDLAQWKLRVFDARDWNQATMSVKDMAIESQAVVALNANFFDEKSLPLGLVLIDGKIRNPPKKISWWGLFLARDRAAQIVKQANEPTLASFQNGIQAGPRLVIAGRVPKLKPQISPKSAVGIDGQGRLLLIASEGSIEITEFAQWLARSKKRGGLGLRHALNLDGGSSTQLYAKLGNFQVNIPSFHKVPIALGVIKK